MKMMFVTAFVIAMTMLQETSALSCHAGRAGCFASCQAQNCATGYCTPSNKPASQQICRCSRCGRGATPIPPIPVRPKPRPPTTGPKPRLPTTGPKPRPPTVQRPSGTGPTVQRPSGTGPTVQRPNGRPFTPF